MRLLSWFSRPSDFILHRCYSKWLHRKNDIFWILLSPLLPFATIFSYPTPHITTRKVYDEHHKHDHKQMTEDINKQNIWVLTYWNKTKSARHLEIICFCKRVLLVRDLKYAYNMLLSTHTKFICVAQWWSLSIHTTEIYCFP